MIVVHNDDDVELWSGLYIIFLESNWLSFVYIPLAFRPFLLCNHMQDAAALVESFPFAG